MKYFLILIILSAVSSLNAQNIKSEVLGSAGNISVGSSFQLSYTIGEAIGTVHLMANDIVLSQGFEQSKFDTLKTTIKINELDIPTLIYPNPTFGPINIDIKTKSVVLLNATLYNMQGKQVIAFEINNGMNQIDINEFAAGSYMLVLATQNQQQISSYIIQKLN